MVRVSVRLFKVDFPMENGTKRLTILNMRRMIELEGEKVFINTISHSEANANFFHLSSQTKTLLHY